MTLIAHLSDPHLDISASRLDRLARTLDEVAELGNIDLLLVTGDVADHGRRDEYAQFFEALDPQSAVLVVPGNHDLRSPLAEFLPAPTAGGFLNAVATAGETTVVGLDSLIEGHDEGCLSAATVDFARSAIESAPGHVVLAMHHPPVPVGHQVMDQFGLRNAEVLADLVLGHPSVVAVLTGHVHTALATTFAGRPLVGAPGIVSTMRLGSRTDPIADETSSPGMALHTIDATGHLSTIFHYLPPKSGS